jgi:hypothetical protein
LGQKVPKISGSQNQFDVGSAQQWFDQPELKVARECCYGPDADDLLPSSTPMLQDVDHLFACAENGFSVLEGDLAGLIED